MFYYGYGFDPTIVLLIPAMIFALAAQGMVKSAFSRYSRVRNRSGLTGAQAARRVLDNNGLADVEIVPISGSLTDNYDPRGRVLNLSTDVYNVDSVSAVSVACHEAGHAIQHARGYVPLKIRNGIVPAVNFASSISWILIIVGLFLLFQQSGPTSQMGNLIFDIGVLTFVAVVVFHLITLPVEFNASRRAIDQMEALALVAPEDLRGSRKVLRAAAMTYVAALAMAVANLLRILAIRGRD
jgi:Zn-dependent membrane protease YugP